MKVLQVHNYYRFYGGECSVVDAERRLLEAHGHEVVAWTADSKDVPVLRRAPAFLRIPYTAPQARALARLVERDRPDIAHVHNVFPLLSPSVYAALKGCGVPVVQTIHNYRFLCPNGLFFTHGEVCEQCTTRGYFSAVRRRCVRDNYATSALYAAAVARAWRSGNLPENIDRYVALSRFAADKLISRGVPSSRVRVCGNFVEDPSAPPASTSLPASSSLPASPTPRGSYFLYLGRLSAEKGLWTLLEALRDAPDVTVKIAGHGPLEDGMRAWALAHLARPPELLGFVSGEAKRRLVREARGTIVPSECYENFPLVAAESLALGTPVIASRIGALPEMVDHGETGLLFEPGDFRSLAACMRKLAGMGWSRFEAMALRSAERARVRFGADAHYHRLLAIYEELVLVRA